LFPPLLVNVDEYFESLYDKAKAYQTEQVEHGASGHEVGDSGEHCGGESNHISHGITPPLQRQGI
jgi:hypothetical protein